MNFLRTLYKGDDCNPEERTEEATGQPPSLSDKLKQANRNYLFDRWPFFGFTVLASYLGTIMIIKAFAMKIAQEWATKLASFLII